MLKLSKTPKIEPMDVEVCNSKGTYLWHRDVEGKWFFVLRLLGIRSLEEVYIRSLEEVYPKEAALLEELVRMKTEQEALDPLP